MGEERMYEDENGELHEFPTETERKNQREAELIAKLLGQEELGPRAQQRVRGFSIEGGRCRDMEFNIQSDGESVVEFIERTLDAWDAELAAEDARSREFSAADETLRRNDATEEERREAQRIIWQQVADDEKMAEPMRKRAQELLSELDSMEWNPETKRYEEARQQQQDRQARQLKEAREFAAALELERCEKGYKPGWVYYRVAERFGHEIAAQVCEK